MKDILKKPSKENNTNLDTSSSSEKKNKDLEKTILDLANDDSTLGSPDYVNRCVWCFSASLKGLDDIFYVIHPLYPKEEMVKWKFSTDCMSMTFTQKFKPKNPDKLYYALRMMNVIPKDFERIVEVALNSDEENWNIPKVVKNTVYFPFPICIERVDYSRTEEHIIFLLYKKKQKLISEITNFDFDF